MIVINSGSAWLGVAGIEQTPHRLACHLGDQVIVAVDVQHLERPSYRTVALGGRLELPTNRLTAGCSAD